VSLAGLVGADKLRYGRPAGPSRWRDSNRRTVGQGC